MKKSILTLLAAAMLAAPAANAQLEYKQVGTIKTGDYSFRTNNYPVYTMSKYGEGLTLYPKSFLALNPDVVIKELTYFGYQETKTKEYKFTVYMGNTTETTVQPFVVDRPEGGTMVDTSNMTKFCEVTYNGLEAIGNMNTSNPVLTFTSDQGFNYTGENLIIYVMLNDGLARTVTDGPYTTFFTANNGNESKCIGAYRSSDWAPEDYGFAYSIYAKDWTYNSDTKVKLPVIKLGYSGERIQVDATVTGRIVSSRNNSGISGATVTLGDQTVTTPASGSFSITIEDVDPSIDYTLTASAPGFETKSQVVDLRSGGNINLENIVLTKLPVPAVVSGTVMNKSGFAPIANANISFAGLNAVSAADGSYSFNIANVDDLPEEGSPLSATALGFLPYSTTLRVTGNMIFDIQMDALPELPGTGALIGEWDIDRYNYMAPFNPLWRYSNAQMIYPQAMFNGVANGTQFSSISFYGYYPEVSTGGGGDEGDDDDDWGYGYDYAPAREPASRTYNLSVYMGESDLAAFDANNIAPIPTSALTKVFEGPVTLSTGGSATAPVQLMNLELSEPFVYTGSNVAMVVESEGNLTALLYFCMDNQYVSNTIGRSGTNDLASVAYSMNRNGLPVMRLGSFVPTAQLSGKVTNSATHDALEGVEVTLSGNGVNLTTFTDADGNYTLSVRDVVLGQAYIANYSFDNFYDDTYEIVFTEQTLQQVKNVEMEIIDGVIGINADSRLNDVYTVTGLRVLRNASASDIQNLPKGIYISGGKKIVVK